jgi:hypothetical protein
MLKLPTKQHADCQSREFSWTWGALSAVAIAGPRYEPAIAHWHPNCKHRPFREAARWPTGGRHVRRCPARTTAGCWPARGGPPPSTTVLLVCTARIQYMMQPQPSTRQRRRRERPGRPACPDWIKVVTGWQHVPAPHAEAPSSALWTPGRVCVEEAREVVNVQDWGRGAGIAVGVGVARGEPVQEAGEVLDVQEGRNARAVAVGVAAAAESQVSALKSTIRLRAES